MLKIILIFCLFVILWIPVWWLINWGFRIFKKNVDAPEERASKLLDECEHIKMDINQKEKELEKELEEVKKLKENF